MVPPVIAPENLASLVVEWFQEKKFLIGFIIGQVLISNYYFANVTKQKVYAVHLCPMAPEGDNEDEGEKKKNTCLKLADVKDKLFSINAKQVLRCMPGGFSILGIFWSSEGDFWNKKGNAPELGKLRSLLSVISKLEKHQPWSSDVVHPFPELLLNIDKTSTRFSCRTLDLTTMVSSPHPVEWKFHHTPTRWQVVESKVTVDWKFHTGHLMEPSALMKSFTVGMEPFMESIAKAICLFNGELRDEDEILNTDTGKRLSRRRGSDEILSPINVDFLIKPAFLEKHGEVCGEEQQNVPCGMGFWMKVQGTLCARAYLHSKATISEALEYLKRDVILTLAHRWQMHCDSLLEDMDGTEEDMVLHEPPRRIFVPISEGSQICFCDYIYPEETGGEVCSSLSELLGIPLNEDSIDMDSEVPPSQVEEGAMTSSDGEETASEANSVHVMATTETKGNSVFILGSVLACLFALAAAFFVSQQASHNGELTSQ
ncbi:unnamed protein product [Darwinula stevensoni]|uniref:Uncharacterized protein n=1 Tax=Darwinula stevensoni TaxID=69355 RepID=A0A7R8ZZJ8_9CRUS|nr:unnamed protein product [Darwinula stevensoni]CAG0883835.1 unnamed protein product [Darwinula stevensoni]